MNRDFSDVLRALVEHGARFLVVGAHSLAVHGLPPRRIDLLTGITGVKFDAAWATRVAHEVDGIPVPFLGREALVQNKRAAGPLKDLADLEALGNSD